MNNNFIDLLREGLKREAVSEINNVITAQEAFEAELWKTAHQNIELLLSQNPKLAQLYNEFQTLRKLTQ